MHDIERKVFDIHSAFCRVFSNPKRLYVMFLISKRAMTVGEIAEALDSSVSNTSQHLRVMKDQGAVKAHREGQTIYYRVANSNFSKGAQLVRKGLVEEKRIPAELNEELAELYANQGK